MNDIDIIFCIDSDVVWMQYSVFGTKCINIIDLAF